MTAQHKICKGIDKLGSIDLLDKVREREHAHVLLLLRVPERAGPDAVVHHGEEGPLDQELRVEHHHLDRGGDEVVALVALEHGHDVVAEVVGGGHGAEEGGHGGHAPRVLVQDGRAELAVEPQLLLGLGRPLGPRTDRPRSLVPHGGGAVVGRRNLDLKSLVMMKKNSKVIQFCH